MRIFKITLIRYSLIKSYPFKILFCFVEKTYPRINLDVLELPWTSFF